MMTRRGFAIGVGGVMAGSSVLSAKVASAASAAASTQSVSGLQMPARFIPVPKSVSEQAQKALSMKSPYGSVAEPDPTDIAAWKERVEASSQSFTRLLKTMTERSLPASLTERNLENCVCYEIVPTTLSGANRDKALLYVHGGGFTNGGGIAAAYAAYNIAKEAGIRTFSVDYRMPPEHPFPAGLDDCVEAYRQLVDEFGASNVAITGTSAGGGLAASTLLKARDLGLSMPACAVLHTPEADLTESGDSFVTNLGLDPVLKPLTNSIALYANGHDLRDPYLSPLFGDFTKGFPPTLLSTGTRDLFLSNTVLLHRALRRAGVTADLHVWEAMGHAGFYGMAPEDRELTAEHVKFLGSYLHF